MDVSIDKDAKKLTVENYQLNSISAEATLESLMADLAVFYEEGEITNHGVYNSLLKKLESAQAALAKKGKAKAATNAINAFINAVKAQSGNHITTEAAEAIIDDAEWILENTDFEVAARVAYWAEIVAPIVNQPVGATNIDLVRDYNNESNMGDIVTDSMLWSADWYDDGE